MLVFKFKDINDNYIELKNPLYITINQDEKIPADDLAVIFPYIKNLAELCAVEVLDNDSIVFKGLVDEQQNILNDKLYYTKITARSMAAMLLDNESKPVNYTNPSTSVIFNRHLLPNLITSYKGGEVTLNDNLIVSKGTTDWQVFYNFAVKAFNKVPRIEADGSANFNGIDCDEELVFSDSGGIKYNSIKENRLRCKLISDVIVKSDSKGYNTVINDKSVKNRRIYRKRYYDASITRDFDIPNRIINNSLKNSYEIKLITPKRILNKLNALVKIENSVFGNKEGLYISSINYRLTPDNEETVLVLKKERICGY